MKQSLFIDDLTICSDNLNRGVIVSLAQAIAQGNNLSHTKSSSLVSYDVNFMMRLFQPDSPQAVRILSDKSQKLITTGNKRVIALRLSGALYLPAELYRGEYQIAQSHVDFANHLKVDRKITTVGEFIDTYLRTADFACCARYKWYRR